MAPPNAASSLRNYVRRANFLEALHHLYTTGKPLFPYSAGSGS